MSRERSVERVMTGASWDDFCDALKRAGRIIQRDKSPATELERAEGYRYLSRIARAALETFVEHADARAPVLHRVVHETVKMGSDNPDNYYQTAAISGAYRYVLTGTRGTVKYLGFATQRGNYGQGRGMPPTGHLDASELTLDADGRFEVMISCERPDEGDWLPMEPATGTLIVRQTFGDRAAETIGELTITRISDDGDGRPEPLTAEALDRGLGTAGMLVGGAAGLFASWAEGFIKTTNTLPRFDPKVSLRAGGDPNIAYYHSYWALEPGQALIIDAAPPECEHWNFQLNNHWMESLDYRYFRVHVNKFTATYRSDGSVRIIVSAEDPGLSDCNWIETVGHTRGTMCFRWVRAAQWPEPRTRVVAMKELLGANP